MDRAERPQTLVECGRNPLYLLVELYDRERREHGSRTGCADTAPVRKVAELHEADARCDARAYGLERLSKRLTLVFGNRKLRDRRGIEVVHSQ